MSPLRRLALLFVADGFTGGAFVSYIPWLVHAEGVNAGTASIGFATIVVGGTIATLIVGRSQIDAFTRMRYTVIPSGLALIPLGLTHGMLLLITAFCYGFGRGAFEVSLNTFATVAQQRYGRPILSRLHGGFSLGMLVGAMLGTACLAVHLDAARAYALIAILVAAACIFTLRRWHEHADAIAPVLASFTMPVSATALMASAAFACAITEGAIADWSGLWLSDTGAVTLTAASLGFVGFNVCMTAMRLSGDRMTVVLGDRERLLIAGSCLAAVSLTAAWYQHTFVAEVAGFLGAGLGLANIAPALFTLAGRIGPRCIAVCSAAGAVGFVAGPLLIGAVSSRALHAGMLVPVLTSLWVFGVSLALTTIRPSAAK